MTKGFVYTIVFFLAGPALAQDRSETIKENICYTESIRAARGTSFAVKVFVNNVDTLAGLQVPIYYRSDDVNLLSDSVTFDGSRCQGFSMSFFKIDPHKKVVFFALLNISDPEKGAPVLYPGDGLVAKLWFTAPGDSGSGDVILESGPDSFLPDDRINYGYLFWTPTAMQVKCSYSPGNITLR